MNHKGGCWSSLSLLLAFGLVLSFNLSLVDASMIKDEGALYAGWPPTQTTTFTISTIDPQTAQKIKTVYVDTQMDEWSEVNPAVDTVKKIAYIPVLYGMQTTAQPTFLLTAFDLTKSNSSMILSQVPLPYQRLAAFLYDPVNDGVYVFSSILRGSICHVGFVSSKTNVYQNISALPKAFTPVGVSNGGAPAALDPKGRRIIIAGVDQDSEHPLVGVFDLKTNTFTYRPLVTKWNIGAMVWLSNEGKPLCLFAKVDGPRKVFNVVGYINPDNGEIKALDIWTNTTGFVAPIGAVATLDPTGSFLYTLMFGDLGHPNPALGLVTIDTATGKQTHAATFPSQLEALPRSLFYV